MGELIGQAWVQHPPIIEGGKTYLIPIPLHRERMKQRGYNQAELIASGFAKVTGIPVLSRGLVRMSDTQALYKLNLAERRAAIRGVFQPGRDLKGRSRDVSLFLVDDIYTTGTTVKEAALVLKNAGFQVRGVIALSTGKLSD